MSGVGMSLIFHIGVLRQSNEQTEAALRREHEEHRDILQNSLVDDYQNLTRNISLQADHKQSFFTFSQKCLHALLGSRIGT